MPHGLFLRVKSLSLTLAMLGTACLVPGPAVAGSQSGEVHTRNQSAAPATESDVMAFRRLRTEAIAAATADDLDLAAALLAQADGRIPNYPGLMALQARVDAARGNGAGAISHLQRYARAGFIMNLERDAALSPLSDMPGFAQAADRIAANALPIGADRLSILASVPGFSPRRWLAPTLFMAPMVPGEAGWEPPARFLLDRSTSELFGSTCWGVGSFALTSSVAQGAARAGMVRASNAGRANFKDFIDFPPIQGTERSGRPVVPRMGPVRTSFAR